MIDDLKHSMAESQLDLTVSEHQRPVSSLEGLPLEIKWMIFGNIFSVERFKLKHCSCKPSISSAGAEMPWLHDEAGKHNSLTESHPGFHIGLFTVNKHLGRESLSYFYSHHNFVALRFKYGRKEITGRPHFNLKLRQRKQHFAVIIPNKRAMSSTHFAHFALVVDFTYDYRHKEMDLDDFIVPGWCLEDNNLASMLGRNYFQYGVNISMHFRLIRPSHRVSEAMVDQLLHVAKSLNPVLSVEIYGEIPDKINKNGGIIKRKDDLIAHIKQCSLLNTPTLVELREKKIEADRLAVTGRMDDAKQIYNVLETLIDGYNHDSTTQLHKQILALRLEIFANKCMILNAWPDTPFVPIPFRIMRDPWDGAGFEFDAEEMRTDQDHKSLEREVSLKDSILWRQVRKLSIDELNRNLAQIEIQRKRLELSRLTEMETKSAELLDQVKLPDLLW